MASPAMRGAAMRYAVYAPRDLAPDERLPLVILLHGSGDDERSFDRFRVGAAFDRAIAEGTLPRVVVALPEGDRGFWANWRDGSRRYRDWVLDDLLPEVTRRYHTQSCPEGCHLMGVSMGGTGVIGFLLQRPGLFASASILSAPIFNAARMREFRGQRSMQILMPMHRIWGMPNDYEFARQDPFQRWQTAADLRGTRLTLAYARHDRGGIAGGNRRLHRTLEARHVAHAFFVFEGRHAWSSWTPVFLRILRTQLAPSRGGDEPGAG